LPDGRFLIALGEAGARLLTPDGRTLVHFAQPAHALVLSDHGDRAIAIAGRGEAKRLARIDLVGRRVRAWRDALFDHSARSFDGELFFIALGEVAYAIDAASDGWDAVWSVAADAPIQAIERSPSQLEFLAATELWRHSLPDLVLRSRAPQPDVPSLPTGSAWRVERARGEHHVDVVIHDRSATPRVHVRLGGAQHAGARVYESEVIVWDDTGRLLAIELWTGGITRELRLTA
jgi:hypothetical protein